jgi:predicted nucleic acid-binding protein
MIWVNWAWPAPESYDACYVALAESLGATLATVDLRLTHATGPRCAFATPPAGR